MYLTYAALQRPRGGWTPASLTGSRLWVPASSVVLGTPPKIATLTDLSGLANDLAQGTAAQQPQQQTGFVLGHAVADFDGGDDGIGRADMLGIAANAARYFWVIAKLKSASTRTPLMMQAESGSGGNYVGLDANSFATAGTKFGVYAISNTYDTAAAADTGWHLHVLSFTPTSGAAVTGSFTYYLDGTATALTQKNAGSGAWPSMATFNATWLGRYPGIAVFGGCYIADAGAGAGLISAPDLASLRAYSQALVGSP